MDGIYSVRETEMTPTVLPKLEGWRCHELRWERLWEEKVWVEKNKTLVLDIFLLQCLLVKTGKGATLSSRYLCWSPVEGLGLK